MKKILSIAVIMAFGISFSFAQSATSNTTTSTPKDEVQVASPVVKAVDVNVNVNAAKCSTAAGKSCCNGASKASAITSGVGTEVNATETTAAEKSCHSVTVGMSAAKPETTSVPVPEK